MISLEMTLVNNIAGREWRGFRKLFDKQFSEKYAPHMSLYFSHHLKRFPFIEFPMEIPLTSIKTSVK